MTTSPIDTVNAYFDCIRRGDVRVAELFHVDARLVGLGMIVSGRDAIADFYSASIANASPVPRLAAPLVRDGHRVLAEIYIDMAGGEQMHVIDLFEVDAGHIRSLTYFVSDHP